MLLQMNDTQFPSALPAFLWLNIHLHAACLFWEVVKETSVYGWFLQTFGMMSTVMRALLVLHLSTREDRSWAACGRTVLCFAMLKRLGNGIQVTQTLSKPHDLTYAESHKAQWLRRKSIQKLKVLIFWTREWFPGDHSCSWAPAAFHHGCGVRDMSPTAFGTERHKAAQEWAGAVSSWGRGHAEPH